MRKSIKQLRLLITQLGLLWLIEELDDLISAGNIILNSTSKKFELTPFTQEEELQIIISALKKYFVELPEIYNETLSSMKESLNIDNVAFKDAEESTFGLRNKNDNQNLANLLNKIR